MLKYKSSKLIDLGICCTFITEIPSEIKPSVTKPPRPPEWWQEKSIDETFSFKVNWMHRPHGDVRRTASKYKIALSNTYTDTTMKIINHQPHQSCHHMKYYTRSTSIRTRTVKGIRVKNSDTIHSKVDYCFHHFSVTLKQKPVNTVGRLITWLWRLHCQNQEIVCQLSSAMILWDFVSIVS